jgi:PTS system nitrogen regulatory IIA component
MNSSVSDKSHIEAVGQQPEDEFSRLLAPSRISIKLNVSSKKRLLQSLAGLLLRDRDELDRDTIFQILLERERLGSTGIGDGVALPHGRVNGIEHAIGAFVTLKTPLDYDAIDEQPITMAFALLVPADANEVHLKLLSQLAELFSNSEFRRGLATSTKPDLVYSKFLRG